MALITNPGPELLETKSYPFQRLRYMLEHLVSQEGVWGATDFKVSQRGAGANLSVDVAAGAAWVKGDTGTRQGLYHQVNDGVVNLAVSAAHATLPRIDQVILRMFDSTVSGGSDVPTLSVLAGTPTAGADIDDRLGAAALPNDAIRLADIEVPAADTSITDSQIRDRRPWARGAYWRTARNAGDYSTASGTFAAIDSTNLAPRVECSGVPVVVTLSPSYVSGNGEVTLFVDGVELSPAQRKLATGASINFPAALVWSFVPAAGSHLLVPFFNAGSGTFFVGASTSRALTMQVEEVVRQNASN